MIPSNEELKNIMKQIATVCFTFAEEGDHELERQFPLVGNRLEIIVTPRDRITGADLSFCRFLNVWIDAESPIDFRRARYLWKELLLSQNRPAAIFADTDQGLTVFKPYENKKLFFQRENQCR